MKTVCAVALALMTFAASGAFAADVACPDLATAVRVGACPSAEELRHTFTGYCASDERNYRGATEVCTDFERYRKLKNTALWESADGSFSAYVSCDTLPEEVRKGRVQAIRSSKQGRITVVSCSFGNGVTFSHRTRADCRVASAASCPADPAACRAVCE